MSSGLDTAVAMEDDQQSFSSDEPAEVDSTKGSDAGDRFSDDEEADLATLPAEVRAAKEAQKAKLQEMRRRLEAEKDKSMKDRFRFLLNQSDVYNHFINSQANKVGSPPSKKQGGRPRKPTLTGVAAMAASGAASRRGRVTEKDEDDELVQEVLEDEADMDLAHKTHPPLTSTPQWISGGKLRDYQIEGVNWLVRLFENGLNGILADEMGLGKTFQTVAFLGYLQHVVHNEGPHMVVVPKSVLGNWLREIRRWVPSLKAVRLHGPFEERERTKREDLQPGLFHVVVTTFEIVHKERAFLRKFSWQYLIMDEAHRIKNEKSRLSEVMRTFHSHYRLLLTGTPLQNNLHELWALLNFLLPDIFASSEDFDAWFKVDKGDANNEIIEQLHKVLRPFMLRRLKVDVEKTLPPKREILVHCGMSEVQRKLYRNILAKDVQMLQGIGSDRVRLLNIVMQLRKCANHPYLFEGIEPGPPYTTDEHLIQASGKLVLLDRLLQRLYEQGSRVLIFSQMTRMLDILEDFMLFRGHKYCRIDGQTESDMREDLMDEFNKPGSEKFCFLLSTRAGGLGINLATADTVILYDSDWNPQADLQAQDRAHRIGQTKPVTILRLITEGTVEEKVIERALKKLYLDAMVIQQGRLAEQNKSLSKNELLSMIRFGAEGIFKSTESTLTDEELDALLSKGADRFRDLNNKFSQTCNNNLLTFTLTEDQSLYMFEGLDYSNTATEILQISPVDQTQVTIDVVTMELSKFGDLVAVQLPEGKNTCFCRFETKDAAMNAREKLQGQLMFGQREPLQVFFYEPKKRGDDFILPAAEWIDIGKRERKPVINLILDMKMPGSAGGDGTAKDRAGSGASAGPRMPKQATIYDFQFMNKKRIEELYEKERLMVTERWNARHLAEHPDYHRDQEELKQKYSLTPEEEAEKEALLTEGFLSWSKRDLQSYLRAVELFGRQNVEDISRSVEGKTEEEVKDYHRTFWKRYTEIEDHEKILQRVEKAESVIERNAKMRDIILWKLQQYQIPLKDLEIPYGQKTKSPFSEEEDRFLLVATAEVGYGDCEALKVHIRYSWALRFDWFLKSRSPAELSRRVEYLVKLIQKEYEDDQKARAAAAKRRIRASGGGAGSAGVTAVATPRGRGAGDGSSKKAGRGKTPTADDGKKGKKHGGSAQSRNTKARSQSRGKQALSPTKPGGRASAKSAKGAATPKTPVGAGDGAGPVEGSASTGKKRGRSAAHEEMDVAQTTKKRRR